MPQDFLPSDDTGQLRGSVQTATGTSFDQVVGLYPPGDEDGRRTIPMSPMSRAMRAAT